MSRPLPPAMNNLPYRFSICGKAEIEQFSGSGLTHLLSLEDPETLKATPAWFRGEHLQLFFHDVESAIEARMFSAWPPTEAAVADILKFGERCLEAARVAPVHLLVHCFAGISRSTAAAYALAAQAFGAGRAVDALQSVCDVRPEAFPNRLVVRHADRLLGRNGELVDALEEWRRTCPG